MTISKRLSRTSHQAYKKVTCIKWEKPLAKKYCQITSYMLYCVIKQLAPFVKALKTLYSMEYQVWNENDLVCSVYERIYYYLLFTVHAVDNSKTFWNGQITVYHFECIQNWCHQNWKLDMLWTNLFSIWLWPPSEHQWLHQISMKLPYAVLRKSALKFTKGRERENSISYYFLLFWFNQNSISVLKTLLSCLSEKTLWKVDS